MEHTLVVDGADIGGKDGVVAKDGGREFRVSSIATHEGVALTRDEAFGGDKDAGMGHRTT